MAIKEDYLELLACPACKGELTERRDPAALCCSPCALDYPVEEGIPVLLIERAERRGA